MNYKNILSLIFIALIVIFSIQNAEATDVNFLFWNLSISRVLVILGSFSIGILVGVLMSIKFKKNRTNSF
ncbi:MULTISPECIES: lipopolysaccharide assembly protein LapA domain-containing protein [unclassified Polaribacter]|uniref:lipopolysaccharide assembly protein LapA domain-containing protein n=1 Tax=unclassified Polaribacter TaxID=196858 RepID=UPI0014098D69|nr:MULTISPECIES: LapA family protein [unclassified Polaribacter]